MAESTEYALRVRGPDGRQVVHALDRARVTVGRSRDNDVCHPEDGSLSRSHFVIERSGDAFFLQDQRSKNRTYLNGRPVSGRERLRPGDRIAAGHLVATFEGPGGSTDAVEFYAESPAELGSGATVMTRLDGLLSGETSLPEVQDARSLSTGGFAPTAVQALIEAGRELAGHGPLDALFERILDLSIQAVGAERGVLMAYDGERLVTKSQRGEGFRISTAVRDRVLAEKTSILVRDLSQDEAFANAHSLLEQNVQKMMAVPLQTDRQVIGLVYVDSQSFRHTFREEDLNLLTVLANVAAIRIEHQRLLEVELNERSLKRDIEQAASIQRQLLPASAPDVGHLELAGSMSACHTVGGDYYDYLAYPDGRIGVVLGDVSGKGLSAALIMTSLRASVRLIAEEGAPLDALVWRLDRSVAANVPDNRFVSLVYCEIPEAGEAVTYCNAGHNPPILVRSDGAVEELDQGGGTVLGMLPQLGYETAATRFAPGDVLVLFSDGVTEATAPDGEEFGQGRLADVAHATRDRSASSIVAAVLDAIDSWSQGAPPSDDVTVVVAKRARREDG